MRARQIDGLQSSFIPGVRHEGDLCLDANSVYWTDGVAVTKVSINGGAHTILSAAQTNSNAIVVDASRVFWTNYSTSTGVQTAPLGGGPTTVVAPATAVSIGLAQDATHLYWTQGSSVVSASK